MEGPVSEEPDYRGLVARARKGDQAALSELVRATQPRLFRFCLYLCGNPALAQDLCQDAYVRALENLKQLKGPENFPGWLLKTAKNLHLDHVKSPRNAPGPALEDLPPSQEPATSGREAEDRMEVHRALAQLPLEDRQILLLIDVVECTYAETSEIIGISDSTLRFRLHHIRKAFLAALKS
jgi:RNA polymerase sigma-70 factor, ECF subfamily